MRTVLAPLALTTILAIGPVTAHADPPSKKVAEVCAHLEENATEYSSEEAAACEANLSELAREVPSHFDGAAKCLLAIAKPSLVDARMCLYDAITAKEDAERAAERAELDRELDREQAALKAKIAAYTPPQTKTIRKVCDHMAAKAVDYPAEEAAACADQLLGLANELGPAFDTAAECILALPKPTRSQTSECVNNAVSTLEARANSTEFAKSVEAEVARICSHLEANASQFDADAAAQCSAGVLEMAVEMGSETFARFSTCILAEKEPSPRKMTACIE